MTVSPVSVIDVYGPKLDRELASVEPVALHSLFGYTDIEHVFNRNITMVSNQPIFAGVDISTGKKPLTFAVLDRELNIIVLERLSVSALQSCLKEYEKILLALNSTPQSAISVELKQQLVQWGLKALSKQDPRQFVETSAQDCFRSLLGQDLLPRRTLEGRIQRSLILYEEGFQIPDPMDFFEEITRHKLMQGILPVEKLFSTKELNALIAAYLAWMVINRPGQVQLLPKNVVLPKPTAI